MTSTWDLDNSFRDALAALDGDAADAPGHGTDAPGAPARETDAGGSPNRGSGAPGGDPAAPLGADTELTGAALRALFDAGLTSRQLDLASSWLRSWNEGYQVVDSGGHEAGAVVASLLRPTDPAFLDGAGGAFYCARAAQVPGTDPISDVLGAVLAVTAEPLAGGRHGPYGSRALAVVPTSSNRASHLPRAVGLAFGLERARRLGLAGALGVPDDSVVVAGFSGVDANHASAASALNAAGWCARAGLPLPLLLVCRDESAGDGPTAGWVAELLRSRPGLEFFGGDGTDLVATHRTADDAVRWVRVRRRPAVLHLTAPRPSGDRQDPLVAAARRLVTAGLATGADLLRRYDEIGWEVRKTAEHLVGEPRAGSAREVLAPLSPRRPLRVMQAATDASDGETRRERFGGTLPEDEGPLTVADAVNRSLCDAMAAYPRMVLFGPRVATDGGDHRVTGGLRERFGGARVFDTFDDETAALGLAFGAGLAGLLPVVEVPRLSQVHNAAGQIRDEAAPAQFFSQGAYRNPLVIRVPGFAADDGYGGHARNENAVGSLREIPGLVVAVPARPDDAALMLRTCVAAADTDGTCSVFLEPTPLYQTRDLHAEGDGAWLAEYPSPERWRAEHVPIGRARVYGDGGDLTIVTYGDGLSSCLRVSARLAAEGVGVRVVDLRWLAPLPFEDVLREATATGRVLLAERARRSGGVVDALLSWLVTAGFAGRAATLASEDSYVPLGPSAAHVLLSEQRIEQVARTLVGQPL